MELFDSFSLIKLTEGSTLINFSLIFPIFMFWGRKMRISSMYMKYVALMSSLYLKEPNSKESKNKEAKHH